jgi:hypothetical protein
MSLFEDLVTSLINDPGQGLISEEINRHQYSLSLYNDAFLPPTQVAIVPLVNARSLYPPIEDSSQRGLIARTGKTTPFLKTLTTFPFANLSANEHVSHVKR